MLLASIKRLFQPREAGRAAPVIVDLPFSGRVIYAIGDVHGCIKQLKALEADIFASESGSTLTTIVHLGDMIDRGPDSAGVIDYLLTPPPPGFERLCLTGNHEVAMLRFLDDPRAGKTWLENGGIETLRSYGIGTGIRPTLANLDLRSLLLETRATIPTEHVAFLRGLPTMATAGDYVFVHAGIRPGVALQDQDVGDLLEMRNPGEGATGDRSRVVVHGHTPTRALHGGASPISIDTGCYATGRLSAIRIDETSRRFLSVTN